MRRGLVLFGLATVAVGVFAIRDVVRSDRRAAPSSDRITVDSTRDSGDVGRCRRGGGCTLRAAILVSNARAGLTTIRFSLRPFDAAVHTIVISSALPPITTPVVLDGYSEPGSRPNSAPAPEPLNGRPLVELAGGAGATGIQFRPGSDASVMRGFVLTGFTGAAVVIDGARNVRVAGNYVGTDPAGLRARPNGSDSPDSSVGIQIGNLRPLTSDADTIGTVIGGRRPQDRNLVSGNFGGGFSINATDTTIQGNYIGVAADGVSALGNSSGRDVGTGALTIDGANGVKLGGPAIGAGNVISGNHGWGVSPLGSADITIQGNLIGTDWSGTRPLGNGGPGVIASGSDRMIIGGAEKSERNVISANGTDPAKDFGNVVISGSSSAVRGVRVVGNDIGVDASGRVRAEFARSVGVAVLGNVVDAVVGGTTPGAGNVIGGTGGAGVLIGEEDAPSIGRSWRPRGGAVLGNSIFDIASAPVFSLESSDLGIELAKVTVSADSTPIALDHAASTAGAVVRSARRSGRWVRLDFALPADAHPRVRYRLEVFVNATKDAAEGEVFLGAVTVSPGPKLFARLELPTTLHGPAVSVTTTVTEIGGSPGRPRFGSTSEFSVPVTISGS